MALTDNLVSYYTFDSDATDSHSSNDGTVTNAVLTTSDGGIIDEGYDFDGTGDYISMGDVFDPGSGNFTWQAWVKFDASSAEQFILNKGDQGTATGGIVDLRAQADNKLRFSIHNGSTFTNAISTSTISTGTWYHVVIRRGDSGAMSLWVNDSEWATATSTGTVSNALNFLVGGRTVSGVDGATNGMQGVIDEVAIWSRAITDDEIEELYNSGSSLAYPFVFPPVAAFSGTPTSGSIPTLVTFTDASTNTPTSWAWDFGDGYESSAQHPTHTYTSVGSYTVSLTATNGDGSDAEIKNDYIIVERPTTTRGTKEIARRYPVTSGLTAETTKQEGRTANLVPEHSHVRKIHKTGL